MATSSRDSSSNPNLTHKRSPPSPPPSTRLSLTRLHSRSNSLDTQHNATPRSRKAGLTSLEPDSATNRSNKTSRIMSSVKRSLAGSHPATPKKHFSVETMNVTGMYSTIAERTVQQSARLKRQEVDASPPSIEQIAMGLHISRTPHLRPPASPTSAFSQRRTPIPLPPPPSRSAMKKPTKSSSVPSLDPHSSTTVTSSNLPPTPRSTHSLLSLKLRMTRLMPSAPSSSIPSPTSSFPKVPSGEVTMPLASPKKAVRFSISSSDLGAGREE
ncbi:hypothetical protein FB446DRAFT_662451 [Lentinula raphanica]|nr:hypothetical protein FB446DRAFT_662451 [Lentinula raphanica]